jgi:predicted aspartyl protease
LDLSSPTARSKADERQAKPETACVLTKTTILYWARSLSMIAATTFIFANASALAAPKPRFDEPPAEIVASASKIDDVMARWKKAAGSEPDGASVEDWTLEEHGMTGSQHNIFAGEDYREITTLGPVSYQSGRYKGQGWHQNENGLTVLLSGVHQRNAVSAAALREAANNANVRLLGEVAQPQPAYVVEVAPPGGRKKWLFLSKATGLLIRTELAFPDRRVTIVADDFRTTAGYTRAWHLFAYDTFSQANPSEWRLVKYDGGVALDPHVLDIPGNKRVLDQFPAGLTRVEIPSRFIGPDIIVRLNVDGRGLDFVLDSGASEIVFDQKVAMELGLTSYRTTIAATASTYVRSEIVVPRIEIGPLTMANVKASSLPFHYDAAGDTKVVGLLGFDFIADAVIHVDYVHRKIEAISPSAFQAERLAEAIEIPVALDDGVPMASARVGEALGSHFIIDTGASDIVIFSEFALAHKADIADVGGGKRINRNFPAVSAAGVGGTFRILPVQLKSFVFAHVHFLNFVIWRVEAAPSFEGEDADGLIGWEFLHYYDLYFDYRNGRLLLVKNEWLKKNEKPIK